MGPVYHTLPGRAPERSTRLAGVKRVLRQPSLLWPILNAQLRLGRRARIPFSVRLNGKAQAKGGGEISVGDRTRIIGTMVPVELVAWPGGRLEIGERCSINYGTSIAANQSISIGNGCYIGQYAIINDNDYHGVGIEERDKMPDSEPVVLEDGVWLGARVIVLKGVRIGHDAVIGAGSVVMRDIPPRTVAVGHPARVVREF